MTQVKMFFASSVDELETKINIFLKELDFYELVNIKYTYWYDSEDGDYTTAMIIYKVK